MPENGVAAWHQFFIAGNVRSVDELAPGRIVDDRQDNVATDRQLNICSGIRQTTHLKRHLNRRRRHDSKT